MSADLIIRDVRAVLPSGEKWADIEVNDGQITSISPAGQGGSAHRTIAGEGREAYPGLVDPHVHFRNDESAVPGDNFVDMAEAAARGGATSVIAFVLAPPQVTGRKAVLPIIESAQPVPVDFGLHYILWPHASSLDSIPELVEVGVGSFKMFLAYPERGFMFEGQLAIDAVERVAQTNSLMLVHCEDGTTAGWLDKLGRRSLGDRAAIQDYLAARPENLESVSVAQVGLWAAATRCSLHLVHLSTAQGVAAATSLRDRGQDVSLETCPQYLELGTEDLMRLGPLAKFAPVLRPPEHQAALWEAVSAGQVTIIGSDHSGHSAEAKREILEREGIFGVPFGMPGLETLFPVLYTAGVLTGRLSRGQLAALVSTNAAKRFGLFPRKGVIAVGSQADLLLVDPDVIKKVDGRTMRSNAGYSPFDGRELRGWPTYTILRGQVVCEEGNVIAAPGQFLRTTKHAAAVQFESSAV